MQGPLIFIGTHAIQQGKLETAKQASLELAEFLKANHHREIHFEIYIDDDTNQMKVIQIHPDDESLLFHVEIARERIAAAYEFLDGTVSIEIYGRPGEDVRRLIGQMAGGAPVSLNVAEAGFSRLAEVPV